MPTSGKPAGYNHMATRGVKTMGLDDKIKNATEEATGKVKEKTGEAMGNPDLQDRGTAEKVEGKIQKKVGDIKKVFDQ